MSIKKDLSPIEKARNGEPYQLTDVGNATRFYLYNQDKVRYCAQWSKWLIWNGKHWEIDEKNYVYFLAQNTNDKLLKEVKALKSKSEKKAILKWYLTSQSKYRIEAMVSLASKLPKIAVTADEFDKNTMLLNCLNGTIDLRTGDIKPHNPDDMITKVIPVKYDSDVECPGWLVFLNQIMNDNEVLISYLQRIAGLCLTGDISEQVIFIFFGTGANGKSVFLDTLSGLMGKYACESAPDLLTGTSREHKTEIADLCGKRLVITSETEKEAPMKVQLIKRLTGNEKLKEPVAQ